MHTNLADPIRFEQLLIKPISVFEDEIGDDFENNMFGKDFYYISDEFIQKNFYGMSYNVISVQRDDYQIVQSISIHFREVIDQDFYDNFIEVYGEPNHIHVIQKRTVISEGKYVSDDGDFISNVRKSEVDVREGTFDEKPLFIIWNKEYYQIKAYLRHKQNISEIIFSTIEK
ncbi:hypothetical protein [Aquimarina sp. SS2-1]|uniref:hypothetical protein n=1 Tax=Aquimarina besae TaxID=3342247 RepID=UPI00367202F7